MVIKKIQLKTQKKKNICFIIDFNSTVKICFILDFNSTVKIHKRQYD